MLPELIERIHSPDKRVYVNSPLFERGKNIKICLLDFLDAPEYFVTEQGLIWNRKEFNYLKKNELMWKGYLPNVIRDKWYRVPWVYLPTKTGGIWYPVDLIVGWAFHPTTDKNIKYFKCTNLGLTYQMSSDIIINSTEPPVTNEESSYKQFIDSIYV
jgi:hypothetical protein